MRKSVPSNSSDLENHYKQLGIVLDYANKIVRNLLDKLTIKASKGDADAAFCLSRFYSKRDDLSCFAWTERAAESGHAMAKFNLACYLTEGRKGASVNLTEAASLMQSILQSNGKPEKQYVNDYLKRQPELARRVDLLLHRPATPPPPPPATHTVTVDDKFNPEKERKNPYIFNDQFKEHLNKILKPDNPEKDKKLIINADKLPENKHVEPSKKAKFHKSIFSLFKKVAHKIEDRFEKITKREPRQNKKIK
jgi:TPR repeat protein